MRRLVTPRREGRARRRQTVEAKRATRSSTCKDGTTSQPHVVSDFLAVFVTALTLRSAHRDHEFQEELHDVTEQIERLAMMVLLILFGGALVSGLLAPLSALDVVAAIVILVVVRPLAGLVGLAGFKAAPGEKLTLAFFGIRGVGPIYYVAYGLNHMEVEGGERLWSANKHGRRTRLRV